LFDRICEIIEDIQSPIDRKLKLIPLFVHMHHDPILSAKVITSIQVKYMKFLYKLIKRQKTYAKECFIRFQEQTYLE
jgi:hypothetical protein